MVNFTIAEIAKEVKNPLNIRNISIAANVDAGKTTISDSLVSKAGIIAEHESGTKCKMDTRKDEQDRGITIKSCSISLHYHLDDEGLEFVKEKQDANGNDFLINLIDTPGHIDFSSEVTAALRVTDGGVIIVDCVSGVSVQTETVMRQMIQEHVKPVLCLNKVDRGILEKQLEPEELYQTFDRVITDMNNRLSSYVSEEEYQELEFDPVKGNVIFGSAYHGWGFSLKTFALMYAKKGTNDPENIKKAFNKYNKKLWGYHYLDPETNKWNTSGVGPRGFVKLILEPIYKFHNLIVKPSDDGKNQSLKMAESLGIPLTSEDKDLDGRQLVKVIMRRWIPVGNALLDVIINHLPSPISAQKHRVKHLYTGDQESEAALAIKNCDPNGPLVIFISKTFPTGDNRFYAFGRIFSGTVRAQQKIYVLGPKYEVGATYDMYKDIGIQRVVMMMANRAETMDSVPAGNVVALVGIDQYLTKSATLVDSLDTHPIKPMEFSVSPVVQVSVSPKDGGDLPKLVDALKKLVRSDPVVKQWQNDSGQYIIAGAGELHIEILLKDLEEDLLKGKVPLIKSDPIVPYAETIVAPSKSVTLSKSPDGLNRIFMSAEPVPEEVMKALETGKLAKHVKNETESRTRYRKMTNEFGLRVNDFSKFWGLGPYDNSTNMIVDETKGVSYLNECKKSIQDGFEAYSRVGILTGEPLMGVRFNLRHGKFHEDRAHRGADVIMDATRRAIAATVLNAEPRFMEPIYRCEIQCPQEITNMIYGIFLQRRGHIYFMEPQEGSPLYLMKGYLPVAESFGFAGHIRGKTSGKAFPEMIYDHMEIINEDPFEEGTYANKILTEIRKRKGMPEELPKLDRYCDKMSPQDAAYFRN